VSIFIDRTDELDFLEKKFKSASAELLILYGRRRIGKTELINKFLENRGGIYFLGRLESRADTLKRLNYVLMDFFKDVSLSRSPIRDLDEFFEYLAGKSGKRLVIAIDEFPFIVERFPECLSVLQDKWDSLLKNTRIMVILSGSSVGMMEKYAINYESPLYGRRTGQWHLKKLNIGSLKEFFPKYSAEDLFIVYSFIDTIPGYLVRFDPDVGVWENIKERILSRGESLYEEVEVLLREEMRDPSNYMSILSSIAGGCTSFNEVHTRTTLDKSMLSKYLYVLEKLGITERILPVTGTYKSRLKAKGSLYLIKDNFFDSWFRFVFLNKQELERGQREKVLDYIKANVNGFLGKKFEDFSMEFLYDTNPINFTMMGRWWLKDNEIDIAALNEKTKEIVFFECKWKDLTAKKAESILEELKVKSKYVNWNRKKRKEHFGIIAKKIEGKATLRKKGYLAFDLKDF